jgi:hypothetical protein
MATHVVTISPGEVRPIGGTCRSCHFDALAELTFYTLREDGPHVFARWVGCARCMEA